MGDNGSEISQENRLEALVTQWESLQQDSRELRKQSHRRIIRGTVVLALVAGYAVEASARWLFGFIPVIIGLLFIVHVQESNNVFYRNWKCYEIEQEVKDRGVDSFDWTAKFGSLTRPNEVVRETMMLTRFHISPWQAPSGAIYILGLLVYLGFAGYTVVSLPTILPDQLDWAVGTARATLVIIYLVLTVVLIGVGATNWHIRKTFETLHPNVGTSNGPDEQNEGEED